MPLVNVVGIDNLSSNASIKNSLSFYIFSAVLSNEEEQSYCCLLERLKEDIVGCGSVDSGILVTDDDKSLKAALVNAYSDVHITKNFEAHAFGRFNAFQNSTSSLQRPWTN